MIYSLKQAADATGKSKPTILRAIQSGKISGTRHEITDAWQIDPAELHRLYPPVAAADKRRTETQHHGVTADGGTQREIELLREMLAGKDAVIDDLREDRDRWRTQAEKLLITDQRERPVITLPAPVQTAAKRSWWRIGGRR
jgi:hypothetical protein